jgi:hypothetical protein
MDATSQPEPSDDSQVSTPTEPIWERIKKSVVATSWRDSAMDTGADSADTHDHDIQVFLGENGAITFSFYCGGPHRGRRVQLNLHREATDCILEWRNTLRATETRRQAEARRRHINRVGETLKGSPICDITLRMLQGYDRMLSEQEAADET